MVQRFTFWWVISDSAVGFTWVDTADALSASMLSTASNGNIRCSRTDTMQPTEKPLLRTKMHAFLQGSIELFARMRVMLENEHHVYATSY